MQLTARDITCLSNFVSHQVIFPGSGCVVCDLWETLRPPTDGLLLPLVAGAAPDSGCLGTDVDGTPLLLLVSSRAQRACALRLPLPPSPGSAGARIEVGAC